MCPLEHLSATCLQYAPLGRARTRPVRGGAAFTRQPYGQTADAGKIEIAGPRRHAGLVEPKAHRDHGARADEDQRERRHELRFRRLARSFHACLLALDGRTRPTIAGSAERRSSG